MERYESYKDSGVAWIGQVPSHWIHSRIKFCLSRSVAGIWGDDEKGNKDDIVCFRVADFDYSKGCLTFDKLTIRNVSAAQLQNRLLHDEDLLIEKSGGGDATPVGRVVRFNYNDKAICSNFIHSISVKEGYSGNYLYYYFYGMYANKVNLLYFNQTTGIQNLKVGEYLSQTIYLPTLVEQQAIAAYLDKRCSEIDKAIATQQKRIALLQELKQSIITHAVTQGIHSDVPLKDSGVEWIGKIPSHWDIIPLKRIMQIRNGQDYKLYTDVDRYPVIGSGGCFTYCSKYLYDGEALLLGRKGTIDKPLYIKDRFWVVDTMFYAVPKILLSVKYCYYQALTIPFDKYSTSTALPSMTQTDLGYHIFCLPPFVEQQAIATYLDRRCSEIDKAIATQQKRIALLQELKQSIITEVITGKIKVC